ncbi:MAG: radical SAM family heme chaperone HemW [Bacteroidales bacterium]
MAGIYIHIPFCRSACHYCDFYFTVDLRRTAELCEMVGKELIQRSVELRGDIVETIYFGGGTPSLLASDRLQEILEIIHRYYSVSEGAEITLEANPEDLNREYLKGLQNAGFNRLSVGVQSFDDEELRLLNRRHSGEKAIRAIDSIRDAGFMNFNVDLIFGIPGSVIRQLEENLGILGKLQVPHFSAYSLTYEPGTVLDYQVKRHRLIPSGDEESLAQFSLIRTFARENGYIPYEISNYCKEGFYSRHNTSYWAGVSYLGVGPGAHSFRKSTRRWNQSNLFEYLNQVKNGNSYWEEERLSREDEYHEYLLTRLRTIWGVDEKELFERFGEETARYFKAQCKVVEKWGWIDQRDGRIFINEKGIFVADRVVSEFFLPGK